eukprot:jgi/Tetstr1/438920/TSEL_027428.t1
MAYAYPGAGMPDPGFPGASPIYAGYSPGFPGAGNPTVSVVLNGMSRRRGQYTVQTVGEGGVPHQDFGFDETFPPTLAQVWSPAEWGGFIGSANEVVERHLRGMYRWRYAVVFAPFLLFVVLAVVMMATFMSGGFSSIWVSFSIFFLVMALMFGGSMGFAVAYRKKLTAALSDLTALCHATNQNTQHRGLTWSLKQAAGRTRRYSWQVVWLQGDLAVAAPQPLTTATGVPAPGQPYPSSSAASTAVPLPTYSTAPPAASAADPLPWPVTAGGAATGAGTNTAAKPTAPQYAKTGAPDLDWPV